MQFSDFSDFLGFLGISTISWSVLDFCISGIVWISLVSWLSLISLLFSDLFDFLGFRYCSTKFLGCSTICRISLILSHFCDFLNWDFLGCLGFIRRPPVSACQVTLPLSDFGFGFRLEGKNWS